MLIKSPVGGLPESYEMFDPERALWVGVIFAVLYEVAVYVGVYLMTSRAANIVGLPYRIHLDTRIYFRLGLGGFVPFASLVGTSALARVIFRGTGVFAGDVFTAGAALLPFGMAMFLAGIVGLANIEVILVLYVFAFCYTILMLYSGFWRIAGIPEAGAAPAVPLMLLVSVWLTKVILTMILT